MAGRRSGNFLKATAKNMQTILSGREPPAGETGKGKLPFYINLAGNQKSGEDLRSLRFGGFLSERN